MKRIRIRTKLGTRRLTALWRKGGLAVTPGVGDDNGWVTVTHEGTGLKLATFKTQGPAEMFARDLLKLCSWTFKTVEKRPTAKVAAIRRLLERWGARGFA